MTKLRIDAFQTRRQIHFRLELSKGDKSYATDATASLVEGSNELQITPESEMSGKELVILEDIARLMIN